MVERWRSSWTVEWRKCFCFHHRFGQADVVVTVGNGTFQAFEQNNERTPVASVGTNFRVVELENANNMSMTFAVMNVSTPVAEVSRMVQAGHTVVFTPNDSFVQTSEDVRHFLIDKNGVYVLKARIPSMQSFAGRDVRKPAPRRLPRKLG